jgi:glycerophosphoryl diester phosphodiesterase
MSIRSLVTRIWVVGLFFVCTFSWNISAHAQGQGQGPGGTQGQGPIGNQGQGGQYNYNPYHIMTAIENRHSDLVIVAAHRGLHSILSDFNNICCEYTIPNTSTTIDYSATPENSLQSIYNAAKVGVEVIELDVRTTQDGVPILSHDSTWGRETNVGWAWRACGSPTGCFNPWGPLPGLTAPDGDPGELGGGADASSDPQASVNPNVNGWSLNSVQQSQGGIQLRTSTAFQLSQWNEHPPTLQNALDYIKANRFPVVISLDVKDANDAVAAWFVVANNSDFNGQGYWQTVFFKMDAAWNFPWPTDFKNKFRNYGWACRCGTTDDNYIKFMPVFQTSGIQPGLYGSESAELSAMQAYNSYPFTVGIEVNLKQNPGILTSLYNWGDSGATPKALADFNPYKEWTLGNVDATNYLNYQYFYSNGYCCAYLSNYFYNGAPHGQPSDSQDQRPDWSFILANRNGFNFLTTDNPLAMGNYLWNRGQRNTSYFY